MKKLLAFVLLFGLVSCEQSEDSKIDIPVTPELKKELIDIATNNPTQDIRVVLQYESVDEVIRICKGKDKKDALACAFKFEKAVCIIITPKPPEREYSANIDTHTSDLWKVLGHELMHCYGWTH